MAVTESSIISAQRTAASAALAARELHAIGDETTLGLIGCGVINFEIARFVLSVKKAYREQSHAFEGLLFYGAVNKNLYDAARHGARRRAASFSRPRRSARW